MNYIIHIAYVYNIECDRGDGSVQAGGGRCTYLRRAQLPAHLPSHRLPPWLSVHIGDGLFTEQRNRD